MASSRPHLFALCWLLLALAACSGNARAPLPAQTLPAHTSRVHSWAGPEILATDLGRIEQQLRSPSTPDSSLKTLGRDQQAAYIQLAAHSAWLPLVLDRMPADVRPAVQTNLDAGAELRALSSGAPPSVRLPDWKVVAPAPAAELLGYYREAEGAYGVSWSYLAAINLVESAMGRIQGNSSAGAQGPMQFLPSTWDEYGQGGDINDPHAAILAAARFLKARGAPAAMDQALYGYNPSDHYVRAISLYAQEMQRSERAYLGYYQWRVYVDTVQGGLFLDQGFGS